jgi:hypothetical protein
LIPPFPVYSEEAAENLALGHKNNYDLKAKLQRYWDEVLGSNFSRKIQTREYYI